MNFENIFLYGPRGGMGLWKESEGGLKSSIAKVTLVQMALEKPCALWISLVSHVP